MSIMSSTLQRPHSYPHLSSKSPTCRPLAHLPPKETVCSSSIALSKLLTTFIGFYLTLHNLRQEGMIDFEEESSMKGSKSAPEWEVWIHGAFASHYNMMVSNLGFQ